MDVVLLVVTVVVVEGFTVVVEGGLGHQLGGEMVEGHFQEDGGAVRREGDQLGARDAGK